MNCEISCDDLSKRGHKKTTENREENESGRVRENKKQEMGVEDYGQGRKRRE